MAEASAQRPWPPRRPQVPVGRTSPWSARFRTETKAASALNHPNMSAPSRKPDALIIGREAGQRPDTGAGWAGILSRGRH